MAMFKEVADIKTADMLALPVPEAHFHNVAVKPSEMQKEMVASLAERAEKVRSGGVDSSVDNMLKITNDGRKLALDQRMLNDMLPDYEGSKINACVDNIYRIWEETTDKKSAQLVFCDLSTPKNDGTFSVYNDIRKKLIERGIPESEVRFIHEADTDVKKKELFQKTRKGEVRVLLGSTQKMGAGTNVQDRLIALHDVDCPWRPADLEQRSGRIIRQGNSNPEVDIYRYVTEQTFDAYLYQLVEGKQKFASQIMTSKSPVRSAEDIDETALSYAEIKMLATGNPYIKEKMDLDIQVQKLKLLKSNFLSEKYALEDKIIKYYPQRITSLENRINGLKADVETAKQHPKPTDDRFIGMEVKGVFYSEKAEAGKAIIAACKEMTSPAPVPLGRYRGFETELSFDDKKADFTLEAGKGCKIKDGKIIVTKENGTVTLGYKGEPEAEVYLIAENLDFEAYSPREQINDKKWDSLTQYEKNTILYEDDNWRYWKESKESAVDVSLGSVDKTIRIFTDKYNGYSGRHNFLLNMGYKNYSAGTMTLTFSMPGEYTFDDLYVACQPMASVEEQTEELGKESLQNIKTETNCIRGDITTTSDKILVFSIPYSAGFTAYVDGEKTELVQANSMYMGLELKKGRHTIALRYCTPYIVPGMILTVIGLILFAGIVISYRRQRKQKERGKQEK